MSNGLKKDLLFVFILFALWRISIFLIAYLAPNFIQTFGAKFPYFNERLVVTGLPEFIWSFGNFDGVHYLGIASVGYAYQFTQAFFPLYPLLIRMLSLATGFNFVISGLFISNIAFLFGLVFFYKLIMEIYDTKIAKWSCIYLVTFPTSFYFGSIYTEGIFFLFTTASFYLLNKNRIFFASIVGFAAALTRLVGVFLSISLQNRKKINLIPLLIIPLGLLTYMIYLKITFNNPFYFLTSQSAFGQGRTTTEIILLPQVLFRWIKQITTTNGLTLFNACFEFVSTVLVLLLLVLSLKKVKKEWVAFSFFSVITPTLTGSLTSMPRYILIAFPMFIVLATIKNIYVRLVILIIFSILLVVSTALFTRGYWIA